MYMKYIIRKPLLIVISLSLTLLALSCGEKKEETKTENKPVETVDTVVEEAQTPEEIVFMSFSYNNITIYYPSDYPNADKIEPMAKSVYALFNNDCQLLNIPMPINEIFIKLFNGPGQFRENTGQNLPFILDDTLFNWPPNHVGLLVMEYLIPSWNENEPKLSMYKQGLMKLMDGSGRNYHEMLFKFMDNNQYIPLDSLSRMTRFDSKTEAYQSAIAASFVDFIIFYYGREAFEKMYNSPVDFKTTVNGLYDISVETLEKKWHDVVRQSLQK